MNLANSGDLVQDLLVIGVQSAKNSANRAETCYGGPKETRAIQCFEVVSWQFIDDSEV